MTIIFNVLITAFWGLITLSALVFVHEGGHFLAARACGVRVTEFFLGLPCRFNVHHTSKKIGTKFGITPLLLGGYAAICGMDPTESPCAPDVLDLVHRRGTIPVSEIASELGISDQDAMEACALLLDWGSIAPKYDLEAGERPDPSAYPTVVASVPRDTRGNTIFDGKDFLHSDATCIGDPWKSNLTPEEFYHKERDKTYIGKGFWQRTLMLLAGIMVNIASGFLLLICVYSLIGITGVVDTNVLGGVEADSPAYQAGLRGGDTIVRIADSKCDSWTDIINAIDGIDASGEVKIKFKRDSKLHVATVDYTMGEKIGVSASTETRRLNVIDSARLSWNYVSATAQGVVQLINPQHTKEVLDNSTSIVGISVMSSEAASSGIASYLSFAALISFSLGFMNLLPIPPLDGGKFLIEIIQVVLRRNLSARVQSIVSYVGIALFALLFVYMLRADILRFIL